MAIGDTILIYGIWEYRNAIGPRLNYFLFPVFALGFALALFGR